ncbi:MAG: Bax inhibitor-1 family protein [Deltaproteobacteria bacterium]|nr:Bax inhibitor-1 family protein [Deltaproteobacteria bacterium]
MTGRPLGNFVNNVTGKVEPRIATLEARLSFIRKVYALFFVAILVASTGVFLGMTQNPIGAFARTQTGSIVFYILAIVSMIAAYFGRHVKPLNFILLYLMCAFDGLSIANLLSLIMAANLGHTLGQAFVMTAGVFGGLTAYVFISKKDFSFLSGFLWVGLIILILASLVFAFMPESRGLGFVIAVGGVFLMSGFILYDTSNILHHYDESEYIDATIQLFIDFFLMFIYILRILVMVALSSRD